MAIWRYLYLFLLAAAALAVLLRLLDRPRPAARAEKAADVTALAVLMMWGKSFGLGLLAWFGLAIAIPSFGAACYFYLRGRAAHDP